MFENLSKRLQQTLDSLRGRGRISEADLKRVMREIRMSLLEADVNFEVAKAFTKKVQEKALGQKVYESLTPAEQIYTIVYDELKELLGSEPKQPELKHEGNVWFLVGLQGTGKTTAAGKLAKLYKSKGRRPLLVAADTQRPAARDQLRILAEQVGVPVLEVQNGEKPAETARRLREHLAKDYRDLIIVDTAGRLQIDEALMDELAELKGQLEPTETLLVIDSMMGQEALGVSRAFDERIGVSGLILTKLDGDARGGAALSARYVTGKPIYFGGTSEKLDGIEPFYPDRLAQRILGMGDIQTLMERAQAAELEEVEKAPHEFDLNDLLKQMKQIQKMGSMTELVKMIPGLSKALPAGFQIDPKATNHLEAIIQSMTPAERRNPRILNASRRRRIARGSGTSVQEINRLIKTFEETKGMMKTLAKSPRKRRGFFGRR